MLFKPVVMILASSLVERAASQSRAPRVAPQVMEGPAHAKFRGEVRTFKPGDLLEVDIGMMRSKSYNLRDNDVSYVLEAGVAKGQRVEIAEGKDATGRKVVAVHVRRKD